jgi:hypothetical protein
METLWVGSVCILLSWMCWSSLMEVLWVGSVGILSWMCWSSLMEALWVGCLYPQLDVLVLSDGSPLSRVCLYLPLLDVLVLSDENPLGRVCLSSSVGCVGSL